jgi:putative oxygen-independent coproporphyrinogen III oxidase
VFGAYIHVPFCSKRCDYCAFATWTDRFHLADRYLDACLIEASKESRPATSVYFGGGTPSLLAPDQIHRVLEAVAHAAGAEITVECNPETVDAQKLAGYRNAGVNRLSFGVQSMVPHVLAGLGRRHDVADVRRAVEAAGAAGFSNTYSVDLIFGGAGESTSDWVDTLEQVMGLDPPPEHVSAYALTAEAGTPLARDRRRHPDPDDQAEKYVLADQIFEDAGLTWYEISNWSRPARQSLHNQLYWAQGEYIGIGCAAHSHRVGRDRSARRYWNARSIERYMAGIGNHGTAEAGGEDIGPPEREMERLELALRTAGGAPSAALPGWTEDPVLVDLVEPVVEAERLRLTRRGRLLANEVLIRLQPAGAG